MELKGIKLISGFALNSNQPLDSRAIVSSISELSSLVTEDIAYIGMIVYVNSNDDKKGLYVYNGESWKPVATSASQGDIEIPEVDLTGYATEQYVKDEIAKIDYLPISGGNVNGSLSAYNFSTDGTVSANEVSAFMFKSDNTEAALQVGHSNEVSFGSNGDTIYLGYENRLGTSGAVSKYNFGCSNGQAGAMGGTIYCGEVYVDNGTTKVAREHSHPYLKTDTSGEQGVLGVINAAGFKGNSFSSKTKGTDGACIVANTSGTALLYGASAATAAYEIATKKDIQDLIEIDSTGTKLIINI